MMMTSGLMRSTIPYNPQEKKYEYYACAEENVAGQLEGYEEIFAEYDKLATARFISLMWTAKAAIWMNSNIQSGGRQSCREKK